MNSDRLVGSTGIRLATLVFSLLCVTAVVLYERDFFSELSEVLLILAIGSGVLAFIGLTHSFRVVYSLWMKFAETLHTVTITLLFGACYLVVVPVFFLMVWPFDPLRLRNRSEPDTFWIQRRNPRCDPPSLQRMG